MTAVESRESSSSAWTSFRNFVSAWPITTFMLCSCLTNALFVAAIHYKVRTHGLGYIRVYSPAIWAVVIGWLAWGKKDAWKLVSSLWVWRGWHPAYLFFALLYPSLVAIVSLLILGLIGLDGHIQFDWAEVNNFNFFLLTVPIATVEEVAWVGFLLTAYAKQYRLFQAASLMGIGWGIWYIPLVLTNIQVTENLPVLPLLVNFASIGAICGWLYIRTRSAGVVWVMQMTTNYTTQLIPVLPQRGGMTRYVAFILVKAVFSLSLYYFWGPRPMFGRNPPGVDSSLDPFATRGSAFNLLKKVVPRAEPTEQR